MAQNKNKKEALSSKVDICIVGAGMVGAACACAFAKQGLQVAVIEPYLPAPFTDEQSPDIRVSALNRHSLDLLESLKALEAIKSMRYRNYDRLEVWESSHAKTSFSATDIGEHTLGMFAENRIIQLALIQAMQSTFADHINLIPHKAKHIDAQSGVLQLDNGQNIEAKLIVGADGANSQVRTSSGIGQTAWDYRQRANVILVKMHQEIPDTTWQQFTPDGPLALLPMHAPYASLVWYAGADTSRFIQQCNHAELKDAISGTFPSLSCDFDIVETAGFALRRMHANRYSVNKSVLVGDAAHTINPLAGQGVNLGFKDVTALADVVQRHGLDELKTTLAEYEKSRRPQNLLMMTTMDALYGVFSNNIGPLKAIRNLGLALADKAGPIKHAALKYAMGI